MNDSGDDIEILQPKRQLREVGYGDEGAEFCRAEDARSMAQGYTPPVPLNRECREWVVCKPLIHNGDTQYLVHRVSMVSNLKKHVHTEPEPWVFPPINNAEKRSCGIYAARVTYEEAHPPPWEF